MKPVKLLFATLLLSAAVHSLAQSSAAHFHLPPVGPQPKISAFAANMRAAKATSSGDSSRLIAEGDYTNNGSVYALTDSAILSYSNGRGGDLVHNPQFDTETVFYPIGATTPYEVVIQKYNANNDADTVIVYVQGSLYEQVTLSYDNSHNVVSEVVQVMQGTLVNNDSVYMTYDGNNNALTSTDFSWDASNNVWTPNTLDIYTYNGENEMLSDVSQSWDESANAWDNSSQILYTYDNTGIHVTRTLTQDWVSSPAGWINTSLDTVNYDAMSDPLTEASLTWNTSTSMWDNNYLYTYSNFYNTHPLTEVVQLWNTATGVYNTKGEFLFTYNSHTQLTSQQQLNWIDSTGTYQGVSGNALSRFYYQTYNLAVSNVTSTGGNASIYPVPAQTHLNIELKWDNAQAATISLCDIQGRVLKQWLTGITASYNNTLDVNNLAAGNYIINIKGEKGEIVKQLVVTH